MTGGGSGGSEGHGLPNDGRFKQIVCSILLTLATVSVGLIQGWVSPMTGKLMADDSPTGPLRKDQISLLASMPSYMGFIKAILLAFIVNRFGRRYGLLFMGIMGTVGGAVLTFAKSAMALYVGRALMGLSSGAILVAPMFVSECVHSSLRGMLIAFCSMQINTGILLAYIFGKVLSYQVFNMCMTSISVCYTIYALWLPETPYFLLSKNRKEDAMNSLVWWRGGNARIAEQELATIKLQEKKNISFTEAFRTRQSKVAFGVSMACFFLQSSSGIFLFINYNELIFKEIGNGPFSPADSAIIIAVLTTVATLGNSLLVEFTGRKPLLLMSFLLSALSLAVLTGFVYLLAQGVNLASFTWIPIASIGSFVVSYGIGLAVVPSILLNEMSPTETKPIISAIVSMVSYAVSIVVLQTFVFIDENAGLYVCFLIPTAINIIGLVFSWFSITETKGKSLSQIANELNRVTDADDDSMIHKL